MNDLDKQIIDLHNYLQQLFKWSNSLSKAEKSRGKQLFADLWALDLELLQFLEGEELQEWTD